MSVKGTKGRIGAAFEFYRLRVLGPEASQDEVQYARMAFYAGGAHVRQEHKHRAVPVNSRAVRELEAMDAEFDEFAVHLDQEKARVMAETLESSGVGPSGKVN